MEKGHSVFAEQGYVKTREVFIRTEDNVNTLDNMGLNTITVVNTSQDQVVNTYSLVNTSLFGAEQTEHIELDYIELDYWALPIFIVFITSGVFGNFLVCLAISTNRYTL
jgi:hypothetical protein